MLGPVRFWLHITREQHTGTFSGLTCRELTYRMRHLSVSIVLFSACVTVFAQSQQSDESLLAKTRALYDAPFTRNLVSFDCRVQFDWKEHFISTLGAIPPAAIPTAERLQALEHRVFVDRSGAVVSEIPKATDLSNTPHGTELEQALQAIVSSGLNAWLPFGTNVILPVEPTKFNFQKVDFGYKLAMSGPNVEATLNLVPDMRITNVVSQLPQPLRFATEFIAGPDGYLLQSVKTSSSTNSDGNWESKFAYTYQAIQGFQLPSVVTVSGPTNETWRYTLKDCKVMTGITVEVEAPKK
jgi:hypothetical protein